MARQHLGHPVVSDSEAQKPETKTTSGIHAALPDTADVWGLAWKYFSSNFQPSVRISFFFFFSFLNFDFFLSTCWENIELLSRTSHKWEKLCHIHLNFLHPGMIDPLLGRWKLT